MYSNARLAPAPRHIIGVELGRSRQICMLFIDVYIRLIDTFIIDPHVWMSRMILMTQTLTDLAALVTKRSSQPYLSKHGAPVD